MDVHECIQLHSDTWTVPKPTSSWSANGISVRYNILMYLSFFIYFILVGRAIAEALDAGLSPRRPRFNPGWFQVIFMVGSVALQKVSSKFFGFRPPHEKCDSPDRAIHFHALSTRSYGLHVWRGTQPHWTVHPPHDKGTSDVFKQCFNNVRNVSFVQSSKSD
jgi:hypothetical protein